MEDTEDTNQHYLANWAQDCAIKEEKCPTDAVKNDLWDMQIADKEPTGADEVYLLASDTAQLNVVFVSCRRPAMGSSSKSQTSETRRSRWSTRNS